MYFSLFSENLRHQFSSVSLSVSDRLWRRGKVGVGVDLLRYLIFI